MKKSDENSKELTNIHNARFYKITPRSIERMAYSEILSKLALVRNDHSIEIWNFESCPFLETVIPKAPGISVEDLIWSGIRLFSVGITGFIVEWDLRSLKVKKKLFATGNAIWCIARSPDGNQLAVGTEEGYITVYSIKNDDMIYEKLLDKQSERIVCLEFDQSGEMIVAGSLGFIKIWSIKTGRSSTKMSIGRIFRHQEAIVWSLRVLSDFTILCGDSKGCVTVWDGHMGALIDNHQVLKADVLTISVNEEENLFLCSGVEPVIKIYSKTLIKREDSECYRWVKCLQRRVHEHDIKSVICFGNRIFSGSIDGYLGISSVLRGDSTITKYGPFLKSPCAVVAAEKQLILVRYPSHLEVWTSGKLVDSNKDPNNDDNTLHENNTEQHSANKSNPNQNKSQNASNKDNHQDYKNKNSLALGVLPKKSLVLKSKNEDLIICASISPNSKWISVSTLYETRLFRYTFDENVKSNCELNLIRNLPAELKDAILMQFSSDSKRLFIVQADTFDIVVFDLEPKENLGTITCIEKICVKRYIKEQIYLMTVSPCNMYIAVASVDKKIGVWFAEKGKTFEHILNLPRYSAPPTAIAFRPNKPLMVATYSDSRIIEYDLEAKRFICNETTYFVENANIHCIQNIILSPKNHNIIVLQNDSYLFSLEKIQVNQNNDNDEHQPKSKLSKRNVNDQENISSQDSNISGKSKFYRLNFKFEKSYEHLLQIASLSSNEIFALIVNLESFILAMPPVLKQKIFGIS